MKRTICRQILLNHFQANPNQWIKLVDMFSIGYEHGHSPISVDRRLREMREEGIVKVDYYDGKYARNLVMYSYGEIKKVEPRFIRVGDVMIMR